MRFCQYNHGHNSMNVGVSLHKTNNFNQTIWHKQDCQPILIFKPSHEKSQTVILKNLSGYLELQRNGSVTLWKLEKEKNTIRQLSVLGLQYDFVVNVKKIKAKDFEHYAEDFKPDAKNVLFIFNN